MIKQFVNKFIGLMMVVSFTGCALSDGDTRLDESVSLLSIYTTFYDLTTSCTAGGVAMHCCPDGAAMIGIHVGNNRLKCGMLWAGFTNTPTLDAGTARNDMHACPFGQVMVGVHVGRNLLACQQPLQSVTSELVDAITGDGSMHVCPDEMAMAGIRVDRNQFTCAR